jgi:LysM repeat protein
MNKKMYLVIGIVVMIVMLSNALTYTVNAFTRTSDTYEEVIVQSNDTLWEIAAKATPDGQDIRNTVYQIRKLNKLESAMLHPGQRLLIPQG